MEKRINEDIGREHQSKYTETKEHIAEILTKYLPRKTFEYLR